MKYIIETKDLTKKYKNQIGVNKINMKVEKGKIYGLLGKNGAGKTTTMCMLLNLSKPSSGEIYLFGKDYKKNKKEIYSKIGSIIETPGFYENLTGYENLKILSHLRGNCDDENIREVLNTVGLSFEDDKPYKNYSLGMKQRLGIASAIVHKPELLILDEPINGLDPVGIPEIRNYLKKMSREFNTTILISSHILSEIELLADVIGVINEGELIEEITMEELNRKKNKYVEFEVTNTQKVESILNNLNLKLDTDYLIDKSPLKVKNHEDKFYRLKLYNCVDLRFKINSLFVNSGIEVNKMNLEEDNLEEYFTSLIGGI